MLALLRLRDAEKATRDLWPVRKKCSTTQGYLNSSATHSGRTARACGADVWPLIREFASRQLSEFLFRFGLMEVQFLMLQMIPLFIRVQSGEYFGK